MFNVYQYYPTFNAMKAYANLTKTERLIIENLDKLNNKFDGGYSQFTRNVLNLDVKKNVSNVRKAMLNLQGLNVVCILTNVGTNKTTIYLNYNWIEELEKRG